MGGDTVTINNSNLIKARKEKNFTQDQLAKLIGCTKSTISNWETGYSKPNLLDAKKISEVLGKDLNHLFFDQEVQEPHTF